MEPSNPVTVAPLTVTEYGIWIHGKGWLRVPDNTPSPSAWTTDRADFAKQVAADYGPEAVVKLFDEELGFLEPVFIQREAHNQLYARLSRFVALWRDRVGQGAAWLRAKWKAAMRSPLDELLDEIAERAATFPETAEVNE